VKPHPPCPPPPRTSQESGLLNATDGAAVEVVGSFNYMNGGTKTAPAVTLVDTPFSAQWGGFPFDTGSHPFARIINETRDGVTAVLLNTSALPGMVYYTASPPAVRMTLFTALPANASERLAALARDGLRWDGVDSGKRHISMHHPRPYALVPPAPIVSARSVTPVRLPTSDVANTPMVIPGVGGAQPITFYVATNGNDSNDGSSPSSPFATVQRALAAVSAALSKTPGSPVSVFFRNGTYFLGSTVTLDATVSGTAGAPVTFARDPALPPDPAGLQDVIWSAGGVAVTKWGCVAEPPSDGKPPYAPYGLCGSNVFSNVTVDPANIDLFPTEAYWVSVRAPRVQVARRVACCTLPVHRLWLGSPAQLSRAPRVLSRGCAGPVPPAARPHARGAQRVPHVGASSHPSLAVPVAAAVCLHVVRL
jgi:hypothetical protein